MLRSAVASLFIALSVLAVGVLASRASSTPHAIKRLSTAAIASSTLASSRSLSITRDEIGDQSYGLALLFTTITDSNNSETGVSLSCTGSRDLGSTDYRIPACVWDSTNTRYNCEAGPLFWNPSDETSPKRQVFRIDIEGLSDVECTYSFTGGASADSIVVAVDVATKD